MKAQFWRLYNSGRCPETVVGGVYEGRAVYVVDDDEAVRDSLVALLETEGFLVKTFAGADDFLKDLEGQHAETGGRACLLLDLHMPGQSGQELLDFVVVHEKELPVIIMTGNAEPQTRSRALAQGASDFLEKPVDADHLIRALLKVLRQAKPPGRT